MPESMLMLIGGCGAAIVGTCCMLVGIELNQSAAQRALAERRWLEMKLELRRLRREMRGE